MVRPPRQVEVLCRDVVAADSRLEETVDLVEELHGQLGGWLEQLQAELAARRELAEREERRELRRLQRRAARHGS